jgi:hypothetical protein
LEVILQKKLCWSSSKTVFLTEKGLKKQQTNTFKNKSFQKARDRNCPNHQLSEKFRFQRKSSILSKIHSFKNLFFQKFKKIILKEKKILY